MSAEPKLYTLPQRAKAAVMGATFKIIGEQAIASQCFKAAFTGIWQGYEQNRMRDRPGLRITSQDVDQNFGIRELMISEARSLEQTFPIARRIRRKYADYCVGKCRLKWRTGNPDQDKLYQDNWENFMTRCDVRGVHNFVKLTKLAAGAVVGDGDIFAQFVDAQGYLQLRVIENDRISSGGIFNADNESMVGGIVLDANSRPKTLRVWKRTYLGFFSTFDEIQKPDWIHLFNSDRHDAVRGVTLYHSILNQIRDLKETASAEQAAMKLNSKLVLLHKVITGQAPALNLLGGDTTGTDPNSQTGPVMQEYNDGTEIWRYPGESLEAHSSNRPGENWLPFMEFIIRQIAIGVDLPFGVLWHMAGMGKPAILADLQAADRTFQSFMDEIEWKWIRPIAGVECAKAIAAKRLPNNPNWFKFIVGRPPPISIDAGRESAAAINENRMALRSARSWFFENEEDWETETVQCVSERKFLEDECKRQGVDPNNVRVLTPNPVQGAAPEKEPRDSAGAGGKEAPEHEEIHA